MTSEEILSILSCFNSFTGPNCDELWWRMNDELGPLTFLVQCNDVFYWGMSDCEIITPADVPDFKKAIEDSKDKEGDSFFAHLLWIARKRKQRPQVAYYKNFEEHEKKLFDECGPEETQYGNKKFVPFTKR